MVGERDLEGARVDDLPAGPVVGVHDQAVRRARRVELGAMTEEVEHGHGPCVQRLPQAARIGKVKYWVVWGSPAVHLSVSWTTSSRLSSPV